MICRDGQSKQEVSSSAQGKESERRRRFQSPNQEEEKGPSAKVVMGPRDTEVHSTQSRWLHLGDDLLH